MKLLVFFDTTCNLPLFRHLFDELQSRDIEITVDSVMWRYQNNKSIDITHLSTIPNNHYDHIIALGVAAFLNYPKEVLDILRTKIKPNGYLCQTHDAYINSSLPFDITFCHRPEHTSDTIVSGKVNHYFIDWAADTKIFYPEQDKDVLKIFVDHCTYSDYQLSRNLDVSLDVLNSLKSYDGWKKSFKNCIIYRQINNRIIEEVDFSKELVIEKYDRSFIDIEVYSKYIRSSHIFIPTHPESVGWCVIEAATAGNLIVTNDKLIPSDRISSVNHKVVDFSLGVDWDDIISSNNISDNILVASQNSWKKVVDRILSVLS